MRERILVIEDDKRIARILELELSHEGYEIELADNGLAGLSAALSEPWDLILLDLLLPGMGGLDVLRGIREEDKSVPVILLTALSSTSDIVTGLDLGANDYVTKPYVYEELSARVRGHIRSRKQLDKDSDEGDFYQVDDLTVNLKTRSVVREGKSIELTPREFELLVFLLRHKGEALTRERILSEVWEFDFMGDTNLVDVYIRYLRQKIDQGFKKKLIRTRRGIGYEIQEPDA